MAIGDWNQTANIPTAVFQAGACWHNGKVYVCGGATSSGTSSITTVQVYDPVANSWATVAPLPAAKAGGLAFSDGTYVWYVYPGPTAGAVYRYDPVANTWVTKTGNTVARFNALGFIDGSKRIWLLSGQANGTDKIVERYDTTNDTWTRLTDDPNLTGIFGTYSAGAMGSDGKGYVSSGSFSKLLAIDTTAGTSTTIGYPDTNQPTNVDIVASATGKILTLPHANSDPANGNVYMKVDSYDPASKAWTRDVLPAYPGPHPKVQLALAYSPYGDIFLLSGEPAGSATNTPEATGYWYRANRPPNSPTLTAPANNATIDDTTTQRFTWAASDPNVGDSQSQYDLQYRPTGVAKNETQTVTIGGAPTGGTFTLTYGGQTTTAIAYNATAATVQAALVALSSIGANNVAVTGNTGGPWTVTFQGTLGATDVAQMTATSSLTGGTSPGVTVATTQNGVPYPAWTLVSGNTPNQFRDFAAGTFTDGNYEWQARTYDALGAQGPWSPSSFFTAATPTGVPTITDPVSGGTVGASPYTVHWSTAGGQDAYQLRRVADNAGTADTTTIYYDTGTVTDSVSRSAALPFETNNRYEHIQVRVKLAGLWSSWADIRVDVSYTPPLAPTFTIDIDSGTASLLLTITNPTPGTGVPDAAYNDVYVDDGTGMERRATQVPTNGGWRYWTPISGRDYGGALKVTAVAANGVSTSTTAPAAVTDGGSPAATSTVVIDGGTP